MQFRVGSTGPWRLLLLQLYILDYTSRVLPLDLTRCDDEGDCALGAVCFKDECARCLCKKGHHLVHKYSEKGVAQQVCQQDGIPRPLVGQECLRHSTQSTCPSGSFCNRAGVCQCERGLRPAEDLTYCRRGLYKEACTARLPCEEMLGLACRGQHKRRRCRCAPSFRRPSTWTRFVLTRWRYEQVEGAAQECVARAVGEPCASKEQCAAVSGGGAVCGRCGFCECAVQGHVPDVLGTKCGPPLQRGAVCSLSSPLLCDGTQGLQCGDVCSIYQYDVRPQSCVCSQMHDAVGSKCIPKKVGSACQTDLDCYTVTPGAGFCRQGACQARLNVTHRPHLVSRTCTDRLAARRRERYRVMTSPEDVDYTELEVVDTDREWLERGNAVAMGTVRQYPSRGVWTHQRDLGRVHERLPPLYRTLCDPWRRTLESPGCFDNPGHRTGSH